MLLLLLFQYFFLCDGNVGGNDTDVDDDGDEDDDKKDDYDGEEDNDGEGI